MSNSLRRFRLPYREVRTRCPSCLASSGTPPHFHARYAGRKAAIDIDSLAVLDGKLPPRVLGLVIEWATIHRAELEENWRLARADRPLRPIAPLE